MGLGSGDQCRTITMPPMCQCLQWKPTKSLTVGSGVKTKTPGSTVSSMLSAGKSETRTSLLQTRGKQGTIINPRILECHNPSPLKKCGNAEGTLMFVLVANLTENNITFIRAPAVEEPPGLQEKTTGTTFHKINRSSLKDHNCDDDAAP